MTTTLDSLVVHPPKAHRRGVAMAIAGILFVGGAAATTAVIAADDGHSKPAPVNATTPEPAAQDTLVTRYGQHTDAQSFGEQPLLRVGGAR
jgi:hypothetical protein